MTWTAYSGNTVIGVAADCDAAKALRRDGRDATVVVDDDTGQRFTRGPLGKWYQTRRARANWARRDPDQGFVRRGD